MHHSILCHHIGFLGYAHVVNEMPGFVSLECRTFHEIMVLMFIVTQVLFVCINFQSCQSLALRNKLNMLFICGTDVSCAQYKVGHYSKHERLLLDMCLLNLYFTPDWVEQYLGTYQNNVTHISSVVLYDV